MKNAFIFAGLFTAAALVLLYIKVMPEEEYKTRGIFVSFLHDFFSLKDIHFLETVKLLNVIATVGTVFLGFFMMFGEKSFYLGFCVMVLGPVVSRLVFSLLAMLGSAADDLHLLREHICFDDDFGDPFEFDDLFDDADISGDFGFDPDTDSERDIDEDIGPDPYDSIFDILKPNKHAEEDPEPEPEKTPGPEEEGESGPEPTDEARA